MGLILDTSVLIEAERRGESFRRLLFRIRSTFPLADVAMSAVSAVELEHGVHRSRTSTERAKRREYVDEVLRDLKIYPLDLPVASLAGRLEGEMASAGFAVGFEDLVIGATALHLGFSVATLNVRHFNLIPGLDVVTLPA